MRSIQDFSSMSQKQKINRNQNRNFCSHHHFPWVPSYWGILLSRCVFKENQLDLRESKNGNIFSVWNYDGHIAYEDIIEATEDFDIRYCIGTGGYGSVYKAELPSGNVVALKKLHQREVENPVFLRVL
ncbi:hypothetical protein I3760_Q016500 [Carya illinoinensis]|nr:hypothetical protein I3760_Q016500 [Carya illinoinensis]